MMSNGSGVYYNFNLDENELILGEFEDVMYSETGVSPSLEIIVQLAGVQDRDVLEYNGQGSYVPSREYAWEFKELKDKGIIEEDSSEISLSFEPPESFQRAIEVLIEDGLSGKVVGYDQNLHPWIETRAGTVLATEYHERPAEGDQIDVLPIQAGQDNVEAEILQEDLR